MCGSAAKAKLEQSSDFSVVEALLDILFLYFCIKDRQRQAADFSCLGSAQIVSSRCVEIRNKKICWFKRENREKIRRKPNLSRFNFRFV